MYFISIIIIILIFILDITMSILNYRNRTRPIPENVKDIYNPEEYKKWHQYTMEVFRNTMLSKIVNTALLIILISFNIFPEIAEIAESISDNSIFHVLIFLGIYLGISFTLNFGFKIYHTFNIEERYGFNNSTVRTFIFDQIKSILLTIILGGSIVYLGLSLYKLLGTKSLFYVWLILIAISLTINILYTRVFIKIFNKIIPLQNGELKDRVQDLAKSTGYELKSLSIMDASKRSSRLNAFFSGFGKFKSIILYDTLVEKCTTDQIVSVLAHEIGHAKNKDAFNSMIISFTKLGLYLGILSFFLSSDSFSRAFGFSEIHLGFVVVLYSILLEPIRILLDIPTSALSRKAEYRADAYGVEINGKSPMISALKLLAKENFTNLTPHKMVVKLTYSHPPLTDRIESINKT